MNLKTELEPVKVKSVAGRSSRVLESNLNSAWFSLYASYSC